MIAPPEPAEDGTTPISAAPTSPGPTRAVPPVSILIVEDDIAVRTIIERFLRKEGYLVTLASSAAEGLAQLELPATRFDLVLSDIVMPGGMDGIELAAQVARRWPGLPVLHMSGYTRNHAEGQVRVLAKPFSAAQLLAYLQEGLARRSSSAAQ